MKTFALQDKNLKIECKFYIGCTLSELAARTGMKKVAEDEVKSGEVSLGRCITYTNNKTKKENYIVWMRSEDPKVLAHELTHLVIQIYDTKKIPITLENTEQVASYVGEWYGAVYPRIANKAKIGLSGFLPTYIKDPVSFAQITAVAFFAFGLATLIYKGTIFPLVMGIFYIFWWRFLDDMFTKRLKRNIEEELKKQKHDKK